MTEQRRKQIVYVALGAAILYGLWSFTLGRRVTPAAPDVASGTVADTVLATDNRPAEAAMIASRPWGRDPFRPASQRSSTATPTQPEAPDRVYWILSGIVYSESHPQAIINQSPVSVGDFVNGARVVRIERTKVTLEKNGNRFDLLVSKG